jgi:hypothetical protein
VGHQYLEKEHTMILRKGLFALAAIAALGVAAHDVSASVVTVTVDGCNNGENVHTTVSFNCNTSLLGKGSKSSQLCGGIVFAATCTDPDLNTTGNVIDPPCDKPTGDTTDNPDGPPTNDLPSTDDGPTHCQHPDLNWDCVHDPCTPITGPQGIPDVVTESTPLPSSAVGAGGLIAGLAILSRFRRKTA